MNKLLFLRRLGLLLKVGTLMIRPNINLKAATLHHYYLPWRMRMKRVGPLLQNLAHRYSPPALLGSWICVHT